MLQHVILAQHLAQVLADNLLLLAQLNQRLRLAN